MEWDEGEAKIRKSVIQGCSLSLILFNLYIFKVCYKEAKRKV